MAKGKKTGGRDFELGNAGGPGQPPVPSDLVEARKINKIEFERICNKYLFMTVIEIKEAMLDPKTVAIDIAICQVIAKGAKEGDPKRLAFLFDRILGKPRQSIDLSNNDGSLKPNIYLPENGRD